MRSFKSERGFSLVEIIVAAGIMGVVALAMMTMASNQFKTNNFVEFQLKKQEIKAEILGQFLDLPLNCQCWLASFGAQPFPAAGIATLGTSTTIDRIGRYSYPTAGSCVGATMPSPFVTAAGVDNVRANSISIVNVGAPVGATYAATLRVVLESQKDVSGSKVAKPIDIPILLNTAAAGANRVPVSCAMSASATATGAFPFSRCRLIFESWDNDNCTGAYRKRYTQWSDTFTSGIENYALYNAAGVLQSGRGGRNYAGGDIACVRLGMQCQ